MKATNSTVNTTNTTANTTNTTNTTNTIRRGLKKREVVTLLKNWSYPTEPFTIKQAVTSFGVDHWLVGEYVKANASVFGVAPKDKGANGKTRGPAAKLYQLPADKLNYRG